MDKDLDPYYYDRFNHYTKEEERQLLERIKPLLESYQIPEHVHEKGLAGCITCMNFCLFDKPKLFQDVIDALQKDLDSMDFPNPDQGVQK